MPASAALKKVQIARKELAIPEDAYRAMMERLTGHRSAGDCTEAQLRLVLDELKAKGWTPKVVAGGKAAKPAARRKATPADHPSAKKARALWLSLWNLGEIHDSSESALEAFARRQLRVERLQWADQAHCYKLIEALKAMAERAGWSQAATVPPSQQVFILKARLWIAQECRLRDPEWTSEADLADWLQRIISTVSEAELDTRIADNGRVIRQHGLAR